MNLLYTYPLPFLHMLSSFCLQSFSLFSSSVCISGDAAAGEHILVSYLNNNFYYLQHRPHTLNSIAANMFTKEWSYVYVVCIASSCNSLKCCAEQYTCFTFAITSQALPLGRRSLNSLHSHVQANTNTCTLLQASIFKNLAAATP